MLFSSIKEINTLISKGMSNLYYWKKLTFSKLQFFWKENLKKWTSFEEQKGTIYIPGNVYFAVITNPCLQFLLICFCQEIKGF